jgi:hypothetical protein
MNKISFVNSKKNYAYSFDINIFSIFLKILLKEISLKTTKMFKMVLRLSFN